MTRPTVSIIINNFNYELFVGAAIESALTQTYPQVEVIVVDDGSSDRSRSVIERYSNRVIPVLQENGGQASAFNAGFSRSQGSIVCFLDSDDLFAPTKLERLVDAYGQNPEGWCFHALDWIDHLARPIEGAPPISFATGAYDFRAESLRGDTKFFGPATSGLSFSRALLERLLPMPPEIRITSDNYLKLASLALSPGFYISEPLANQRIHSSNAYTRKGDTSLRAQIELSIARGIRANFPELRPICNRMFATGWTQEWKAGGSPKALSREFKQYFCDLPFRERAETLLRMACQAMRTPPHLRCESK